MVYVINRPLFRRLKMFPETKNNSRFYILKLFFSSHDNRFSSPNTSLLLILPQICCILFNMRENRRFWTTGPYFWLVSKERGRGQDKYFY